MNSSVTQSCSEKKENRKNRKVGSTGSNSLLPFGKEQLASFRMMEKRNRCSRLRNHFKCCNRSKEVSNERDLTVTDKNSNHNQKFHFSLVAITMSMLIVLIVPPTTTAVPLQQFVNQSSNNISTTSSVPSSATFSSSFDTLIGERKEGNFINNEFGSGEWNEFIYLSFSFTTPTFILFTKLSLSLIIISTSFCCRCSIFTVLPLFSYLK